jgi:hypothetical protein
VRTERVISLHGVAGEPPALSSVAICGFSRPSRQPRVRRDKPMPNCTVPVAERPALEERRAAHVGARSTRPRKHQLPARADESMK